MARLGRVERERRRDRLERFVLRARKVMAHSLVRENMELLQRVAAGTFKFQVTRDIGTGERELRYQIELPPEEALESFAARLRPFTMRDEPVYWELVLDAIADLTPQAWLDDIVDLEGLRHVFAGITQGKNTAQAYYVLTENGQQTDLQLAEAWLNADALHANPITSSVGNDLDLDERFRAAAGVYARLGAAVNAAFNLIGYLSEEGALALNPAIFTDQVTANTSIDEVIVGGYTAPAGSTPMPEQLSEAFSVNDGAWRPIWEEFEEVIEERHRRTDAAKCRGPVGVTIRWPDGRKTTETWIDQRIARADDGSSSGVDA